MALNQEQMAELQKLQKAVSQLEQIIKVSRNEEQRIRISHDLRKYKDRIQELSPEGMPDLIKTEVAPVKKTEGATVSGGASQNITILNQFPVIKISPSSNDQEINLIGTLINVLDREYLPAIADSHIKLDFSHATERDSVVKHMENIRRNMKVLTETIEEYAQAEKQEFREQLGRMKNKQSRIFIAEAYEVFCKFREFLEKMVKDMTEGGGVIMNLGEKIKFNPRFEKASLLEGKEITEAIMDFLAFVREATENIHVPNITKK